MELTFEKVGLENMMSSSFDDLSHTNMTYHKFCVYRLVLVCNQLGYIRVRPWKYYRISRAVLDLMMFLKKWSGLQIFPQVLDDLFGDHIEGLKKRIFFFFKQKTAYEIGQ